MAILKALAGFEPGWTLTGGAALAGFHLGHRTTRDLDLFWQGHEDLAAFESALEATLTGAGFAVAGIRRTPSFVRLHVGVPGSSPVEVDLVADPVPRAAPPEEHLLEGVSIEVDSAFEIFVNKLTTLLSRSELRDLVDVQALLATGLDLRGGVVAAGSKDGAMSAPTLAWVLSQFPVLALAQREGVPPDDAHRLEAFRNGLVDELARLSTPR